MDGGWVFWCPVTVGFALQCPSVERGLSSSSLPGFIKLLRSFCLLHICQIWLIETRSSNGIKEGTHIGTHTHTEKADAMCPILRRQN